LSTNLLQPSRLLAIKLRSLQLCFPLSFSVIRSHELFGLSLLLVPSGFHCRAALLSSISSLRSVCPIQPNMRCHISLLMLIWPVISHSFSFDTVEDAVTLKYLGTTLTDENCVNEEIKSILNSGNACYHSVQGLLSSRLLSRNVKFDICKTIILTVVLYGC
jgi:hypothetical protein